MLSVIGNTYRDEPPATVKQKKKPMKQAAWTSRKVRANDPGCLYRMRKPAISRPKPSTTPGMCTTPSGVGATKLIASPRWTAISAVPSTPRP